VSDTGSKQVKEKKRQREVRGRNSLDDNIKDDISTKKKDHGKLNKRKKTPVDALEHFVGKKKRRAGEAQKTRVKLT
jgi:hypothetical protein